MRGRWLCGLFLSLAALPGTGWSSGDHEHPFPHNVTFSTLITTPLAIEGLTADEDGRLYTNGFAFDRRGDLLVADTARGALWKVDFNRHGEFRSKTGCDPTLAPNTLCLEVLYVADPRLEGVDGIALDQAGNVWASANERNAIVVVTRHEKVFEVFRNAPDAATLLRNTGPLEFPTSPVLVRRTFCTANSDGNRRDNSPIAAGEIGGPGQPRGKISCIDQRLFIPGLPLPVE